VCEKKEKKKYTMMQKLFFQIKVIKLLK